jgi:hypothetical protein
MVEIAEFSFRANFALEKISHDFRNSAEIMTFRANPINFIVFIMVAHVVIQKLSFAHRI